MKFSQYELGGVAAAFTVLEGRGFGAARAVRGEVVFNTAMAGYVEALTDPSNCGRILLDPIAWNDFDHGTRESAALAAR
jgi:hypothetical protein